jgi:hypothetical protein
MKRDSAGARTFEPELGVGFNEKAMPLARNAILNTSSAAQAARSSGTG